MRFNPAGHLLGYFPLVLAIWPVAACAQERLPVTPASAKRLLQEQASVNAEFSRLITSSGGRSTTEDIAELADTESPNWRLYYRDRQMLFAIPTRRNLTPLEKKVGEQEARDLAVVLLQQRFSKLLDLADNADLDPRSVRVVFIEPAAYELPLGNAPIGIRGVPLPMGASMSWPAFGGGFTACTCH